MDCNSTYAGSIPTPASIHDLALALLARLKRALGQAASSAAGAFHEFALALLASMGRASGQVASNAAGASFYISLSTHGRPGVQCTMPTIQPRARVVKLVDTRDLKSLGFTAVPVRFRSRAPAFAALAASAWQAIQDNHSKLYDSTQCQRQQTGSAA